MANIKIQDFGMAPGSVVPVYRDVASAGQVGQQISQLSAQLGDVAMEFDQRRQNLAENATREFAAQQIQGAKDTVAQSMEANPNDPDAWLKAYDDAANNLPFAVQDYAGNSGLRSEKLKPVTQAVGGQLAALRADVERSATKYRIHENNNTLLLSAQDAANNNDMLRAKELVDQADLSPSEKAVKIKTLETEGMRYRVTAAIAASSLDPIYDPNDPTKVIPNKTPQAIVSELSATGKNGEFLNYVGLSAFERQALIDRASQRLMVLSSEREAKKAKEFNDALSTGAKNAVRFFGRVNSEESLNNLTTQLASGDADALRQSIRADVPGLNDESVNMIADGMLLAYDDPEKGAQLTMAIQARKDTLEKAAVLEEKAAVLEENRRLRKEASQLSKFTQEQGSIASGKGTLKYVDALLDTGKISAEQHQQLTDQIIASVDVADKRFSSINDGLALYAYNTLSKFYADPTTSLEGLTPEGKRLYGDMAENFFESDTYQDYQALINKITLAKNTVTIGGSTKSVPVSEEAKVRALQNVAFFHMLDLNDNDLSGAGFWFADKELDPAVVKRAKAAYSDVLKSSTASLMTPGELGNRLVRITEGMQRINEDYAGDDAAINKAFDELLHTEKEGLAQDAVETLFLP